MDIKSIIKKGKFEQLDCLTLDEQGLNILLHEINIVGLLESDITAYYACVHILNKVSEPIQKAMIHSNMSTLLSMGINYVNGAYTLGFYHEKQAMLLDSQNLQYKQAALQIYAERPDFKMDEEDQYDIANSILTIDPNNEIGLKFAGKD